MSLPAPAPPPPQRSTDRPVAVRADYHRLQCRIRRNYQTITQPVHIGDLEIVFTRIADPNRVLDQVAAEEDRRERRTGRRRDGDELHLPYWAELWDSAMGLAQLLVRESTGLVHEGTSVLDLGCGMGLAGTVAGHMGAHVLFADLEPPALLFAQLNALPCGQRVRTRRLNWRTDRLDEKFDLILGSDIIYEKAQWEYLELFWRTHLAERGRILLGEPGRQTGGLFIPWITEKGWKLIQFDEPVTTRKEPIRIFRLQIERKL